MTGSPSTASCRVLALVSTARDLFHDPLHCGVEQGFELGARVAVDLEVTSERVAHFGLVALAARVLPEHEHVALPAELVHPRPVVARHGADELRVVDQPPGDETPRGPRAVEA